MMQATINSQQDTVASNVADMGSFIKCPICSEVLKNPVELTCKHIFCVSCIERYASGRNYKCPVCSMNVFKRSARPAHETDGAVKFVQNIWKQLQEYSLSNQPLAKKIVPETLSKQEKNSPHRKGRVKPKATSINKNTAASNVKVKAKVSEVKLKKSMPKPKKDATKSTVKGIQKLNTENKGTLIATDEQVIEPYKEHVLRWLQNSKNNFQCSSLTPQNLPTGSPGNAKDERLSKNLVSVSQCATKRRSLPPRQAVNRSYGRNYRSMESLTNISTSMTQKTKAEKRKINPKVFDSPVDEIVLQESQIEEIDSNPLISKSGICKEIEEQCLQVIDQNAERKKPTRKRKQNNDKKIDGKQNAVQPLRPDWLRINKFAKIADKIDGIPKRLKVVCTKNDTIKLNRTGASVEGDVHFKNHGKELEKVNEMAEETIIPDSQFSTTLPSQQVGRAMKTDVTEPRENLKCVRRITGSTVQNILLNNIMKELEFSKQQPSTSQETNSPNTFVIDFNEKYKFKNKLNDSNNLPETVSKPPDIGEPLPSTTDNDGDSILANSPIIAEDNDADNEYLLATQTLTKTPNETLQSKCEKFLTQYNDLAERLSLFFRMDSSDHDGDDNYDKLSLIHRHLQFLQPKFSNMSLILSNNDTKYQDLLSHQCTQTDVLDMADTIDVCVQTSQSPCSKVSLTRKSPSPKSVMNDQGIQTSPKKVVLEKSAVVQNDIVEHDDDIFLPNTQVIQENTRKCSQDVMKNTLDFVDFDTQLAIKQCKPNNCGDNNVQRMELGDRNKVETFTMAVNTEQMPLTDFINGTQLEEVVANEKPQLSLTKSCNKHSDTDETCTSEKKTRRKLYSSPEPDVRSPSPIAVTNKRVKPLDISDSDDDEPREICNDFKRDNISVCFDSESQKEDLMDSPNVDKYLEDVWNRLDMDTSNKGGNKVSVRKTDVLSDVDGQALQAEIKKNTRELIEKCDELISNAGQKESSLKLMQTKQMSLRSQNMSQNKTKLLPKPSTFTCQDANMTESVCDLLADSIFNDDDLFENFKTPSPCTSSRDKPRSTLHNVHSDLIYKDSNTSILTNILDEPHAENVHLEMPPITVLQDIQIAKRNATKTKGSESEEDLIFSTPEGTPTKVPQTDVILEDLVLAPPMDFQDDAKENAVMTPKNTQGNKSPTSNLASSTPRLPQRRSQIWNVTPNVLGLSPIPASPSRLRTNFTTPTAASQNSALMKYATKLPLGAGKLRRVTSTPCSKSINLKSTPPFNHNPNQIPITHFMHKGATLGQQPPPLNISVKRLNVSNVSDEEDLFVPKSASKKNQAVISCSRLGKTEMIAINALANRGLVKYSSTYDASVTHMVVATTDNNCAKDHTIKYVRAVAAGIWVVNCKWVQDSLTHKKLLPEEFYEVYDVSGCDGPKQSRLYRTIKPLFEGFKVYVAPPFQLISPIEVENIVRSLGGITVSSADALLPKDDCICLIVTESGPTQDDNLYMHYQEWVDKLRVATVEFEWLTRSIGAYKLNSLRRFALCTDESLCELGYPQNLLENVPCSFTQNE